jgi:hypothetical protein
MGFHGIGFRILSKQNGQISPRGVVDSRYAAVLRFLDIPDSLGDAVATQIIGFHTFLNRPRPPGFRIPDPPGGPP